MGIYYGDIHYGIKISKEVVVDDSIYLEPIYELIFVDDSEDTLKEVANVYSNISEPGKYRYELLVDISTTHNGMSSKKGWQNVTVEQMADFIGGMYKIGKY